MTPVKNFEEEQEAMEKANIWINTNEHFLKTGTQSNDQDESWHLQYMLN